HATRGDVAQRRHLEGAAQVGRVTEVGAIRAAQSHIDVARILRSGDRGIARDAEIVVAEIGEKGQLAVRTTPTRMTRRAVTFLRVGEKRESAQLRRIEPDAPAKGVTVCGCLRGDTRL